MFAHPECPTIGPEAHVSVPPAEPVVETLNPHLICPKCAEAFQPKRKNQRFCCRQCQKAETNNQARGSQAIAQSGEAKRRHEVRKGRIRGLSHALYETPPTYRAEFLERLIAEARGNAELRSLTTDRYFLRSWDRDEGTGRLHVAHVLDHYCREVYGLRSFEVLNPEAELPDADTLAFPAEYFGPDAQPIYEDGSLKRRQ